MKRIFSSFISLAFFITSGNGQNVGIGTVTPNASAQLDMSSTTKGFLPPRMTFTQRNAIATPSQGLIIFCSNCGSNGVPQFYNGTAWVDMVGSPTVLPNVKICNQVWMTQNLNVVTYRNGDSIPKVADPTAWSTLTTGAYCYYNNDSTTYAATYGKLYNWYAVNDPRGIAPYGWHIPSDAEWTTLITCVGGVTVAGGALKEAGTTHWLSPNTGATNSSGFTGLPGGDRYPYGTLFNSINTEGYWWSSTEGAPTTAPYLIMGSNSASAGLTGPSDKNFAFSVRCVRD